MEEEALPISAALEEARPESLGELFSRDPEGYSDGDLDRIIAELRKQRERLEASDGVGAKPAKPRAAPAQQLLGKTAEELGL